MIENQILEEVWKDNFEVKTATKLEKQNGIKYARNSYNIRKSKKNATENDGKCCGCYWIRTSDFYPVKVAL